jgi:protein-L-isoaspartate O-methyltransferase
VTPRAAVSVLIAGERGGFADTGRVTADAFDAFEREGWRRGRASPYHRGLGPLTSQAVGALLDAASVGDGAAVLDVASGPGYAAA